MSATTAQTWFKFDNDNDEEPSHEANITQHGDGFVVEWSNTAVGLVQAKAFPTLAAAQASLEDSGYADFTA